MARKPCPLISSLPMPMRRRGGQDGIVTHGTVSSRSSGAGKDITPLSGQRIEFAQGLYRLAGQGHEMRRLSLGDGKTPFCCIQIDIGPLGSAQLSGTDED